jgi:hypothetical protein
MPMCCPLMNAKHNNAIMTIFDVYLWPLHVMKVWSTFMGFPTHTFAQPILPGWNFGSVYNITDSNSSAPQTEQEIVRQHSYGRQLGRITEALAVVADKSMQDPQLTEADRKRLSDFMDLAHNIEEIKAQESMKRIQRMAAELAHLQKTQPALYRRAVEALERVLPKSR